MRRLLCAWIALLLLPIAGFAETLERSQALRRAQLEQSPRPVVTLTVADTSASAKHVLEVRLQYDEGSVPSGANAWTYTVEYSIAIGGQSPGLPRTLTLFRGIDRDVFEALDRIDVVGGSTATVTVLSARGLDGQAVPADVVLAIKLATTRHTAFQTGVRPTVTRPAPGSLVTWTAVPGAEEYEVEIAFVDARENPAPTDPFSYVMPVRLRTTEQSIPFDPHRVAGTVYYRVRGVGRHLADSMARRPGAWSASLVIPVTHASALERDKNWDYRRRYDGSGPASADIRYFDGSLRVRQTQSTAPQQSMRIVAETKHDFEGRPAVNLLGAPAPGTTLSYAPNFNRALDGSTFDAKHFDRDGAQPVATSSGAGRYFSPQSDIRGPAASYVPDAGGYPYSTAQHTRDGSRRLRAMSNFGEAQRLGGGHDTRYTYGDSAEQQLRPLFGSNVGLPQHYERTLTADPNRAFEVFYRDAANRIVAQALVGSSPANLSDLAGPPDNEPVTVKMDGANRVDASSGRSTLSYRVANAVATTYHFTYDPSGVEYGVDPSDPRFPPLCESCRYRLRIRVLDPTGKPLQLLEGATAQGDPACAGVMPSSPTQLIERTIGKSTQLLCTPTDFGAATAFERTDPQPSTVHFCALFTEPGEYEVQKTLEFVDGAIDARVTAYGQTPGYFHVSQFKRDVSPAACGSDCEMHCAEALPTSRPNSDEFRQCKAQCESQGWVLDRVGQSKCDSLEQQLASDYLPGGRLYVPGAQTPSVSSHPEYCHVQACRALRPSDQYDLELGTVTTYSDALCRGFLNPLGQPTDPVLGPPARGTCPPDVSSVRDPVFVSGGVASTLRATLLGQLQRYTATVPDWAGPTLSAWQFAADPEVQSQSQTPGEPSLDEQWRLFRSLYLGLKQRLLDGRYESLFQCQYLSDPAAHVKRPTVPSTFTGTLVAIDEANGAQCQAICKARVEDWLQRLKQQCGAVPNRAAVSQALGQYCQATCGPDNPLAILTLSDVRRGAPGLAAAQAALGNCPLAGIAVDDPYVRQPVCAARCCSDTGPTKCAQAMLAVLAERLPSSTGEWSLAETEAGRRLRSRCANWAESMRIRVGDIELLDKNHSRTCRLVLIGPDGKVIPPKTADIAGEAWPAPISGPAANLPLEYTGLTVRVRSGGQYVTAYLFSDCLPDWVEMLTTPNCRVVPVEWRVRPTGSCEAAPVRWSLDRSLTPTSRQSNDTGMDCADQVRRVSLTASIPEMMATPCPNCVEELSALLSGHKPSDLVGQTKGRCVLRMDLEGNVIRLQQPAAAARASCIVRFVDAEGNDVSVRLIHQFGPVRIMPRPARMPVLQGSQRYSGLAVEADTDAGRKTLYLYTDCDFASPATCGTVCEPVAVPSACLAAAIERLRAGDTATNKPPSCVRFIERSRDFAQVGLRDGSRCTIALSDAGGTRRPLTMLGTGRLRWTGAPVIATNAGLPPTGYVVDVGGDTLQVRSDCPFAAAPSCRPVVVGIDKPEPPPMGDPNQVCQAGAQRAEDQRTDIAVAAARAAFTSYFIEEHHNRCFGPALRERFSYETRSREYHYTLRYYDQSGNLVQTVPPEGVAPLTAAEVAAYATPGAQTRNPSHRMASGFRYDSLDRLIAQTTPDTGTKIFRYDRADRLRFSRDSQQLEDGRHSYVKYDLRGRPVESGQVKGLTDVAIAANIDVPDFPTATDGVLSEVVQTVYDTASGTLACTALGPRFLRGRVAAVIAASVLGTSTLCYSYDADGRIASVLRDVPGLGAKRIDYQYDPANGRVDSIRYQAGAPDALHHRFKYDRGGRLTAVESSRDGFLWDRDASYSYYAHGPLARTELGADRIQGVDYTYAIDGRPKGINSGTLSPARDPGGDGVPGQPNAAVPADVAGASLEYFAGDYLPVGASARTGATAPHPTAVDGTAGARIASGFALDSCNVNTVESGCGLYDGSVARVTLGLAGLDPAHRVTGMAYRYDRLYRLTDARSHAGLDMATGRWPESPQRLPWRTSVGYDANGNITTLLRQAPNAGGIAAMDSLTYRYARDATGRLQSNRLLHLNDSVPAETFANDLDDQGPYVADTAASHNYGYDASGRPIRDRAAGLSAIRWNGAGRVTEIDTGTGGLEFVYDGLGQRIAKVAKPATDPATWTVEYFVRDERGNLLATYRRAPDATAAQLEDLYLRGGASVGAIRADRKASPAVTGGTLARVRGDKQYQIASHLGQVLATVSDRRALKLEGGQIVGYAAELLSTTDYDLFGAFQPGRVVEPQPYRFGFSGLERDDDLKGAGNSYYTLDRLFDPRVGRWLSPDPVQLAHASPYVGFSNNPARFGDPRGQIDWDYVADTARNVAITAHEIGKDAMYIASGQAVLDGIASNLVKAQQAYGRGETSEAIAHAIGIQGAIESLAAKDLAWQDGGASLEDRVRMGIGEVSGMNNIARAVTGETEFAEELSPLERVQLGVEGGVKVMSIAAGGAQAASSLLKPKVPVPGAPPKPSVKSPAGPPCPQSFDAHTLVRTPEGLVPIARLNAGDHVVALHPESGQTGTFAISGVSISRHETATDLALVDVSGRTSSLLTTPEHPFWVKGRGWVEAGDLRPADELLVADGNWASVVEAKTYPYEFDAYNLSVDDAASYYVGEFHAWVHNCAVKLKPGGAAKGAPDVAKRPSGFRKQTVQDAWDDAAPGANPSTKACPTCGKNVEVAPGQGRRDWDVDHQPKWKDRNLKGLDRKQVLDEYNKNVRLRCPTCNRGDN